jgi:hypothetical protein
MTFEVVADSPIPSQILKGKTKIATSKWKTQNAIANGKIQKRKTEIFISSEYIFYVKQKQINNNSPKFRHFFLA